MKLKIQQKLVLYILFTALLVFVAAVLYLGFSTSASVQRTLKRTVHESVSNSALKIQSSIESDISALRSLAASISGTYQISEKERVEIYRSAMNVFLENSQGKLTE